MALTGLRGAPSGGLRVLPNKPLLQILVAGAAVPETHEGTEAAACLSRYRLPRHPPAPATPRRISSGLRNPAPRVRRPVPPLSWTRLIPGLAPGESPAQNVAVGTRPGAFPTFTARQDPFHLRAFALTALLEHSPTHYPRTTRRNTRMLSTAYTHAGEDVPTRSRFTKTCPRVSCKCQRPEHGLKRYQNSAT